jgi:hypothetical protein
MKNERVTWFKVKTAGYSSEGTLIVDVGVWVCGDIADGISFQHGVRAGGWVVSFRDIEKIYKMAKAERSRRAKR